MARADSGIRISGLERWMAAAMSIEPCPCIARRNNPDPDAPVIALFSQEEIANFSPQEQDYICKRAAEFLAKAGAHESGHRVISACFGRSAMRATIDLNGASARLAGQPEPELALILASVAGDACAAVLGNYLWRPSWALLGSYIERARGDADAFGICDRCIVSRVLTTVRQNSPNKKLVCAWRQAFEICYTLLADDEIRGCACVLARELQRDTTLSRDEIEPIIAQYDIVNARQAVFASLHFACFPSWTEDPTWWLKYPE